MKNKLYLATIILLPMIMLAAAASASPLKIILKLPADGVETNAYTQDFIYSFDAYPDIINCSLYIDGEIKAMRNTLFNIQNNKISAPVDPGTHEWFIKCYESNFNEVVSETRSFKLIVSESATDGYTKISNYDGSVTYAITLAIGQEPIELPAAKGGDDLEIVMKGKKYIIDVVKIGTSTTGSFVDVRDRANAKLHTLYVGLKISLDLDKDEAIDLDLQLDNVERSRDAYFTVIPFPGGAPIQETPVPELPEEPEQEVEEETVDEVEEEAVVEQPTGSEAPEQPEEEPEVPEENPIEPAPQPQPQEEAAGTSFLPIILIIAIIIVVIIIAIVLVAKKNLRPGQKKEAKKSTGKEAVKEDAEPAKPDEKIDIIKSTGKKAK